MAEASPFDKATLAWTLPWDADWVTAVRFLGASRRLAAGNNRGEILVWDLLEQASTPAPLPVRRLDGHTNVISRLLSTADGRWLLSASYDHTIRYWDTQAPAGGTATVVLNARAREEAGQRPGKKVPAALEAQVSAQTAARTLEGHRDWIQALALGADDRFLVSGDDTGQVVVWDRAAGTEVRRWTVKGWVYALALSPDGQRAFVSERVPLVFDSGRHAGANIWDVQTGQMRLALKDLFAKEYMSAAVFAPDGKTVLVGRGGEVNGLSGKIAFLDAVTGKVIREASAAHEYGVTDIVLHPDGRHFASSGRDTVVRIGRLADGKVVKELGKPRGGQFKDWIHALAFSADGRWLAGADMAGQVQVWRCTD
jgi:WD40 repeat protein